jgi:hypothetical protein
MARNGDYCKINEKIATTSLVGSSILVLEAIVGTRNRLIADYKNELIGRYGGELPSHVAEWFTINETDSISLGKMIKAWSEWATRDSSIVAAVLASRSMVLVAASRRQATRRRGIAILAALKVAYSVEFENDAPPEIGTLSLPIPLLNSVLHSDGTVILDAQHDCLPSGILPTTANRSLEEPSIRQEFLSFPTEQWHLEKDGVLHIPKGAVVQKMDGTDSLDKISILANGAQSRERVTGPLRLISIVIEMAFGRGYRVMFVPLAMRLNPLPIKAEFGYAPMSNIRGVIIAAPRLALDENEFDIYWRKIGMYWSETGKFLGQLDAPEGIFVGNVDGKVTTQCGGTIERVLEAG